MKHIIYTKSINKVIGVKTDAKQIADNNTRSSYPKKDDDINYLMDEINLQTGKVMR